MSIKSIDLKFKSGNDVPVTRAEITIEEWEAVMREIEAANRSEYDSGFNDGYENRCSILGECDD